MVDCSHANSGKDPTRQPSVANDVVDQRLAGNDGLRGLMIESHLSGGRQDVGEEMRYGVSITDACLGFEETGELLLELAAKLAQTG
jgi:3-deoxy-7-phosphoheptulonate synthase